MADKVTGQIGVINPKKLNEGTPRAVTLYSLKLENDDRWFRLGKESLEGVVSRGDYVEFEFEVKKNQNVVDTSTVKKLDPPKASSSGGTSGNTSAGGNPDDPGSWARKDLRVTMLSARNSAIEVTKILLEQNALVLPAKTQVAKRHEVILGFLDNLTAQYYMDALATQYEDYEKALEYVPTDSGEDLLDAYGDEQEDDNVGADGSDD